MKKGKMFEKVTAGEYLEKVQVLEDTIHVHIAEFLTKYLDGFFQTVENSNRHKGWYAALQQKKLRQRGAKTGFPDIVIWYKDETTHEPRTICLEVKRKGDDARPEQKQIHELLMDQGCPTFVVHSVSETQEVLKSMGVPLRG